LSGVDGHHLGDDDLIWSRQLYHQQLTENRFFHTNAVPLNQRFSRIEFDLFSAISGKKEIEKLRGRGCGLYRI
jgi:hypothetical protein